MCCMTILKCYEIGIKLLIATLCRIIIVKFTGIVKFTESIATETLYSF